MNRRLFIRNCSLAAAASMLSMNLIGMEKRRKWGLQLYSLKDEFSSGVENVIKHVADAGYSFVEPYGYNLENGFWGLNPKQFKAILDRHGLTAPSSHYDFGTWEKTLDVRILETYMKVAEVLKHTYITVPYIEPAIFTQQEKIKIFGDKLNKAGQVFKNNGFKLAYHNHDFEFATENGTTPFHTLLQETDKDLVHFELDLYWVVRSGQDISSILKVHPGRFPMWHIKDMDKLDASKNTEVGQGSIDFHALLKGSPASELKYAFVEQENFDINPIDSIKKSINYLNKSRF